MELEIKFEKRGLHYYENIEAKTMLEAIGTFYSNFGYQRILQIRTVE